MDKRQIKYGLAAFIDVLGFSEKVAEVRTEGDLAKIEQTITFIQNKFEYRTNDALQKASQKIAAKRVLAFTDCLIVFVPTKSQATKFQGSFDVLMQEIDSFGLSQGESVLNGHFLRGGAAIGYWYKVRDTLISSAQVEAYKLESKCVIVPMIGISDELYEFLKKHSGRQYYSSDVDPLSRLLISYPNPDSKKPMWLINYFRICLDNVEPSLTPNERIKAKNSSGDKRDIIFAQAHYRACKEFAKAHGRVIMSALASAKEGRIKEKYLWLAKYHNAVVQSFFVKTPSKTNNRIVKGLMMRVDLPSEK